jgi:UTP--glucose-1-phosphate uridylyltransferase
VKSTEDLLALRSDAYVLTDDARVELDPRRDHRPPVIDLDDEHYKRLRDFDERFPEGAPSLMKASSLRIEGDWTFGAGVEVVGDVSLDRADSAQRIAPGTVLTDGLLDG